MAEFSSHLIHLSKSHPILLYDGLCILCNKSIQWTFEHDTNKIFYFCTLQTGAITSEHNDAILNTVILLYKGNTYIKSNAILKILYLLGKKYRVLSYAARIVPSFFRDLVYDYTAKNRYLWFGKYESCIIPTTDLKARILTE